MTLLGFYTEKARLEFISTLVEIKWECARALVLAKKTKHDAASCYGLRCGGKKKTMAIITNKAGMMTQG